MQHHATPSYGLRLPRNGEAEIAVESSEKAMGDGFVCTIRGLLRIDDHAGSNALQVSGIGLEEGLRPFRQELAVPIVHRREQAGKNLGQAVGLAIGLAE